MVRASTSRRSPSVRYGDEEIRGLRGQPASFAVRWPPAPVPSNLPSPPERGTSRIEPSYSIARCDPGRFNRPSSGIGFAADTRRRRRRRERKRLSLSGRSGSPHLGSLCQLISLCRTFHRKGRGSARGYYLAYLVEIFGPHEGLVFQSAIPTFAGCEFPILQVRVRRHPHRLVGPRQLEHGEVQGVEPRKGDKLELESQVCELRLEPSDRGTTQFLPPVKR